MSACSLRSQPAVLPALLALAVGLALGACTGSPSPTPPAKVPVVVGATTFPASAPIYIAQEKGIFAREGLEADIKVYDAGAIALEDAIAGKLDFCAVAETPIARAVLDGKDFRVIATVAEMDTANYVVARRDRGISRARDLSGKRLGLIPATSADYFQQIYLTTQRVDPRSVTHVPLTPDTIATALASGTVDAIAAWPPLTTDAERLLGRNAVRLDEPGLYLMFWNIAVPREGGPSMDAQERFLRAMVAANDFLRSHPSESRRIVARHSGMSEEALAEIWSGIHWNTLLDQSLILALEDEAQWMVSASGKPRATPDFLNVMDTRPLSKVSPGTVDIIAPGG